MKIVKWSFALVILCGLFFACAKDENSEADKKTKVERKTLAPKNTKAREKAKAQAQAQTKKNLNRLSACDVYSPKDIATLLGVEENMIEKKDMSSFENQDRSICHYVTKESSSFYSLKLLWQKEKAKELKRLERKYEKILGRKDTNGSNKSIEEIASAAGTQILYESRSSKTGRTHLVRKRIGNKEEIVLAVQLENAPKDLKNQMVGIVNSIEL